MKGCDHDVVYSGQTNLECKFAYICRTCGECGWDTRYVMALVDFEEYCAQRVRHGWATPPGRPSPLASLTARLGAAGALRHQRHVRHLRKIVTIHAGFIALSALLAWLAGNPLPVAGASVSFIFGPVALWRLWRARGLPWQRA